MGDRTVLIAGATREARLEDLASRQHGHVSRHQLVMIGFTKAAIQAALSKRRLIAVHRGVYAVGHLAEIPLGRETAALLALQFGVALSHRTALRLVRVLPPDPAAEIEVMVAEQRSHHRRPGIRVHRSRWLRPSEVRAVSGLPTIRAERALMDVAPSMSDRELERAVDEALALRVTSLTKLRDLTSPAEIDGGAGAGRIRRLLEARIGSTATRSEAEERFLALIRDAALPTPELQVPLHGYTVDFYWPRARFAVEIDGFRWHATKSNFERDRRKDLTLLAHGVEVARVSWSQLVKESFSLVATIAGQLSARTAAAVSPPAAVSTAAAVST